MTLAVLRAMPGSAQQFFHGAGDLASVLLDQQPAALLNIAGLVAEKAGGADHVLQLGAVGLRERGGIGIAAEERRSDHVNALVGALGREDGGDQELQWIGEGEGAMRVGIEPGKGPDNATGTAGQGIAGLHNGMVTGVGRGRQAECRMTRRRFSGEISVQDTAARTAEDYFVAALSLMGALVSVTALGSGGVGPRRWVYWRSLL